MPVMTIKMHLFFHDRIIRIGLFAICCLVLAGNVRAQELEQSDSLSVETAQPSWLYGTYQTLYKASQYDPEYLRNEANRLKVRLSGTLQAPYFTIYPKGDMERRLIFDSEPLNDVGIDVGWNIFGLGYSFGVSAKQKRTNERFSFNTYSRFFAINAEILWLNGLSISNLEDFVSENERVSGKIALNDAYFRSRSAHVIFFPGGKKMAYGNTINPVFRQLKNAGTLVVALGYADYDFNTNIKSMDMEEHEWLSELGINKINLSKYELGAGYSYNFVTGRHWVLFVSDMIGLSAKHYAYEMYSDQTPTEETKLGGSNYFRTGACYYNKDYFIGAHLSLEVDVLSTSKFVFNKNNRLAMLYVGYKFEVERFNQFVSSLLKQEF